MKTNIIPSLLLMLGMTVAPLRLLAMSERIQERAETKNQDASPTSQRSQEMAALGAKNEKRATASSTFSQFEGGEDDDSTFRDKNFYQTTTTVAHQSLETFTETESSMPQDVWNRALESMQLEESDCHSTSQDIWRKHFSKEVDDSLLQAGLVFQAAEVNIYLKQALEKIEFAKELYLQAQASYLQGNESIGTHCEEGAQIFKQSASQYVIAAKYFLKSLEAQKTENREIAARWSEASKEMEKAGEYSLQEAEVCRAETSENQTARNSFRRFTWTTQNRAEQMGAIAAYLEMLEQPFFLRDVTSSLRLRKAITQTEAAISYYTEALDAHAHNNHADWLRFTKAAQAAKESTKQFEKSALYLQHVDEANSHSLGSAFGVRFRQAAETASLAAEFYLREEQACLENNKQESKNLQQNALRAKNRAETFFKEAERLKISQNIVSDSAPINGPFISNN